MPEVTMLPCPYCGSNNCNVEMIKYTDATWRYYGYCNDCETCGPSVPESEGVGIAEVNAAERWNALPRRLKWTKEKPTKKGFYWFKRILADLEGPATVFYYTPGSEVAAELIGDGDGLFAGPIPEPKEYL